MALHILLWRTALTLAYMLLLLTGVIGNYAVSPTGSVRVATVDTPAQLQQAVIEGVRHIVVTKHLDMRQGPSFAEATSKATLAASVRLAIRKTDLGEHTSTIRGNCPNVTEMSAELVRPLEPNQCLVLLTRDFLEVDLDEDSHVWVSGLYLKYDVGLDSDTSHTAVLSSARSNLYLTDLTISAEGYTAGAVDVRENQTLFVADSHFRNFRMGEDSVMTIAAGGRATVVGSSFHNISVSSETPGTVAAGPVMRLQSRTVEGPRGSDKGSAAWFTDCTFRNSSAAVPGEVAMEDSNSSVFTNGALPTVWHLNKSTEIAAITVAESGRSGGEDVFANESARLGPFLRSDNLLIRDLVVEQARLTGMQPAVLPRLPAGTDLVRVDPAKVDGRGGSAEDTGTFTLGALAGVVSTVLVLLLVAACCIFRQHKRKVKEAAAQRGRGNGKKQSAARSGQTYKHFDSLYEIAAGIPHGLATNSHWVTEADTTFMGTIEESDAPSPDRSAPTTTKLNFLHAQLNGFARDAVILERFVLHGPNQRRQGGQGIVAFARGVHNDLGYALKFFVERDSFLAERDMYRSQTLGRLLPQVQAEYDPEETPTALLDSLGRPLPPCIAMERGESLPDWSKRAKPDVFQSVAVLAHVATRLRDMHDAGYVHRDIKPENVMFLPRENRWTVIDFGCAACSWTTAQLAYTLVYAPPEVAQAVSAGAKTIQVTPAIDAWALGVVAFELLTGQSAFRLVIEGRDSVLAKLLGSDELAWEGNLAEKNPTARQRLGLFREPILSLLHRDPGQRASLEAFCKTTNNVFSSPTTIVMP